MSGAGLFIKKEKSDEKIEFVKIEKIEALNKVQKSEEKEEIYIVKEIQRTPKANSSNSADDIPKPDTSNLIDSWQTKKDTFSSKLIYLHMSGTLSDVTFQVGIHPNFKIIKGHKLLFSMQSMIFENLFRVYPNNIVPIEDITVNIFEKIVRFVYMISPTFKSKDEAKETYAAAEKYKIPRLKKVCLNFLRNHLNLTVHNIFSEYEKSLLLGDNLTIELCRKFFDSNFHKVLQSKEFLKVDNSIIKNILKYRDTNTKQDESLLFKMIEKWVRIKYSRYDEEITTATLRIHMEEFLPLIKFLDMKNVDFISGPAKSGILNQQEVTSIIMNIDAPGSTELPSWCNKTKTPKRTKRKASKSPSYEARSKVKRKQKK